MDVACDLRSYLQRVSGLVADDGVSQRVEVTDSFRKSVDRKVAAEMADRSTERAIHIDRRVEVGGAVHI